MVLPATVFLTAAALRGLQPAPYEPARTSWVICEWASTHVSRLGAAVLFIAMPMVIVAIGGVTMMRTWSANPSLRQDITHALAMVRRHTVPALLATATLLAGAVLLFAVVHLIVG